MSFLKNLSNGKTIRLKLNNITRDYESLRLIGEGNFSSVYLIQDLQTSQLLTLKLFSRAEAIKKNRQHDLLMEKHCLNKLNGSKFIIKLLGTYKEDDCICLLTEFCEGGELWNLIQQNGLLSNENMAKYYIKQICMGIKDIHSKNIIHRDIKSENILLNHLGEIKIIDFGTALDYDYPDLKGTNNSRDRRSFKYYVGSAEFLPPEGIRNSETTRNGDLWSLGCLIYQIFCGITPFYSPSDYFTYCKALDLNYDYPLHLPHDAKYLIENLLKIDSKDRLNLDDILNHKYLQNVPDEVPYPTLTDLCIWKIFRSKSLNNQEETLENKYLKEIKSKGMEVNILILNEIKRGEKWLLEQKDFYNANKIQTSYAKYIPENQ